MKKFISLILLMATMLSAFSITAFADDNAQGGSGNTQDAVTGYAWYNPYQYLWKVTLYVGKSDQATKTSNLLTDFHRVGVVVMKNTDWSLSSDIKFGNATKVDYYGGAVMKMGSAPIVISDSNCPPIPIVCDGNIGDVKQYFGSTGTLSTIITAIAENKGVTNENLVKSLLFNIGGQSKMGWDYEYVNPNGTTNRVPWLIVYEPIMVLNLKDKVTKLAFTATEFALASLNGWYDWYKSGGAGQNCAPLPYQHLPTSVQLEESWFGYPVYDVTDDSVVWSDEDIIKGGGWGMRWLPPALTETKAIDFGTYFGTVDIPEPNGYGQVIVYWKNYKTEEDSVLCELYRGTTKIWSGYKTLAGKSGIKSTYNVYYPGTSSQTLTAKINYANRNNETDPSDNMRTKVVTPVEKKDDTYDFSVSDISVTPGTVNQGDNVTVKFNSDNHNEDIAYTNILVELLVGDTVVKSESVNFTANGRNSHTYSISLSDFGTSTITARINWSNRNSEDNANNNSVSTTAVVKRYYEFSVSDFKITPNECYENETIRLTFRTDNWDRYNSYNDVLVQLLHNDKVIHTEGVDYNPYSAKLHTLDLNVGNSIGVNKFKIRINWANHLSEANVTNNETANLQITVKPKIDLSIEPIPPNSDYRGGMTVISSYRIINNSGEGIIPNDNNTVKFRVYYYNGDEKVIITTKSWEKAVIPAYEKNLVYFKWTVPISAVGKKVYCEATVNSDNTVVEFDNGNNTATIVKVVAQNSDSQTPDTQYESSSPTRFTIPTAPSKTSGNATWSLWICSNGNFVKKNYGVAISDTAPLITPDDDSPSAEYVNGIWQMRSGYGINMCYTPIVTSIDGYSFPPESAYTGVQRVEASFPEFNYSKTIGKYRRLELINSKWEFIENNIADGNERLHFLPLWFPNGLYIVSVNSTDVWTPAGMISSVRNSNNIKIVDSAYDDWYVGEG